MNTFLPFVSSLVSFLFAVAVLDQYLARRQPYQLVWSIGLFLYCISTATEFVAGHWGISDAVYRLWYLFGAVLVVAYLGMGTVYLLLPQKAARIILLVLVAGSFYAAYRVGTASIDLAGLTSLSGQAMPAGVRALTPAFNAFGTVALVGGAVYSAVLFRRKRQKPYRVVSNALIALGAILPAIGGTSLRLGGSIAVFYLLELIGIAVIFTGFLRSQEQFGYRFHGFKRLAAGQPCPTARQEASREC